MSFKINIFKNQRTLFQKYILFEFHILVVRIVCYQTFKISNQ